MAVEAKGVDDVYLPKYDDFVKSGDTSFFYNGVKIFFDSSFSSNTRGAGVYEFIGNGSSTSWTPSPTVDLSSDWVKLTTTPKHSTIALDNQSITASKSLISQTSEGTQVFTQEMIWDYDLDEANDIINSVDSSDGTQDYTQGQYYRVTSGVLIGKIYLCLIDINNVNLDAFIQVDEYLREIGGQDNYFKEWSGTGFGDTNQFDQLTSGTQSDLNGNTIQTKVLYKPSSVKL